MVKKLQLLTLLLLLSLFSPSLKAQRYDSIPRRTLSLNAAASVVHIAIGFIESQYSKDLLTYIPAIQLQYDFTPKRHGKHIRRLEIGALASYEYLLKNNPSHRFFIKGKQYYEDYQDHFKRYHGSLSAKYFYVQQPKFEAYYGLRAGVTYWEYYNNSRDTSAGYYWKDTYKLEIGGYRVRFAQRNVPVVHAQLILSGVRYFFAKNWGANLELCVGAPHAVSAGVSYRW